MKGWELLGQTLILNWVSNCLNWVFQNMILQLQRVRSAGWGADNWFKPRLNDDRPGLQSDGGCSLVPQLLLQGRDRQHVRSSIGSRRLGHHHCVHAGSLVMCGVMKLEVGWTKESKGSAKACNQVVEWSCTQSHD